MKTTMSKKSLLNANGVSKKDSLSKNKELIKRVDVKNSPFTIITVNKKHFGVMGQYRITEESNSIKKIKDDLEKITWDRIIQVMMILNEKLDQEKLKKK